MRSSNLSTIQAEIAAGELTIVDLAKEYLNRIVATQDLNIYVEVYESELLEKAAALDEKFKKDPKSIGRCFGMILSVKDVICQKDKKVTAASKILEGFTSLYTATALERLLAEDALVIGKVNCDQFGMGSSNENSCYGPTKNADQPERTPGGSSGGSAVAVQAGTCLISLGTDTGGSVRQPAGFTGVLGMKPTYGRISRYGLIAYGSSFDQIGVLGHNLEEIALALEIMAGSDEMDPTSVAADVDAYSQATHFGKKAKIAYFPESLDHPGLDTEIKDAHNSLIQKFKEEGHSCDPVTFDLIDYIVPTYYTLTTAEASTNLARFDGVRYGKKVGSQHDLAAQITASRTAGFNTEVKRRIMLGSFVLSAGYYDAHYGQAQKIRRLLKQKMQEIFAEYDFILMPVSPIPAWKIGEKRTDPTEMYLADIFTVLANLVGCPALAIPLAKHSNGTAFGYQLLAPDFGESSLFSFVNQLYPRITI